MEAGFVGLGKMGRPMTQRLLAAGYTVHVFNRSRGAIDALVAEGATAGRFGRAGAERAEVIMTALPTPESVQTVYAEMAGAARAGQILIDHSTVSPGLNRACAEQLAGQRRRLPRRARVRRSRRRLGGTLTVMVGGEQAVFERALPVFQAFGKNIRLCGAVGAGPGGQADQPAAGRHPHLGHRRGSRLRGAFRR